MNIILVVFTITALVSSTFAARASIRVCSLPHSANEGGCRARIPSFSYNSKTNSCERFIYGGCGGNANRFPSLAECERKCRNKSKRGKSF